MRCPKCGAVESRVIDSRELDNTIRRRRLCEACEERFWTYERIEVLPCPGCGSGDTRLLDYQELAKSLRRFRECGACGQRFTSTERVDALSLLVVKKDGRREEYDRAKLLRGIQLACYKRSVSVDTIDQAVADIEADLFAAGQPEVPSQWIGERVVAKLREIDEVAYVRFASVYRQFRDVDGLAEEIAELKQWKRRAEEDKMQLRFSFEEDQPLWN